MKHIQFCIDEMLAEVEAALANSECVRALAQLDERDARGEPLECVDGPRLRGYLQRQVDALPLVLARRKVVELRALLEAPTAQPIPDTSVDIAATNLVMVPAAAPVAAEPARGSDDEVAVPTVETPSIVALQRNKPVHQLRYKPMHQRLAEAAAAGAGIAVVVMSLWAAPLSPAIGDLAMAISSPSLDLLSSD